MNTRTELFFVYGTLKKGGCFSHKFDSLRIKCAHAEIDGFDLFDLGSFPGIVPGNGVVNGELHEYIEPKLATMLMDTIEGYNSTSKDGMFVRKRILVKNSITDEIVEASVYIFNYELPKLSSIIKCGTWEI